MHFKTPLIDSRIYNEVDIVIEDWSIDQGAIVLAYRDLATFDSLFYIARLPQFCTYSYPLGTNHMIVNSRLKSLYCL